MRNLGRRVQNWRKNQDKPLRGRDGIQKTNKSPLRENTNKQRMENSKNIIDIYDVSW